MLSPLRSFSHLYIEREALPFPDTQAMLERFPRAERVIIDRAGELMNRGHQDWRIQKKSQKIILAVRRDNFIYPMPAIVQPTVAAPAFYNTPLINCLYDCAYCYLQGMYASANLVVYANSDDFFAAAAAECARHGAIYLSLSYDTDLLGFEGILPLTARWIEFARRTPGLTIEIRTKSGQFSKLSGAPPAPNVILAWTISPRAAAERFEHHAASLEVRLKNAAAALAAGWRVRLCIDPILWSPEWRSMYDELIEEAGRALPLERLEDATVGVFRMNGEFFKALKKARPEAAVDYGALTLNENGVATYNAELEHEMREHVVGALSKRVRAVHT